ncbi:MAG TPA: N-acetylmuramoyl-L-alanine amidase [Clostridia bacterium]
MKRISIVVVFILITSLLLPLSSFAKPLVLSYDGKLHKYYGSPITLKVNDEVVKTDMPPVLLNNRSLVPARAFLEKLGATLKWDEKNKKVLVSMKNTKMELKINSSTAKVNNKNVSMDVPSKLINNRTMVPARFIAEQFGMVVGWHPENSLVTISSKKIEPQKEETAVKNTTPDTTVKSPEIPLGVTEAAYNNTSLIKNTSYVRSGDRTSIILSGAVLTRGGQDLIKDYREEYSADGKKYTITFSSNLADIGQGMLKINDELIDSVDIIINGSETSLSINAKDKYKYEVMTRTDVNNTAITLLKPAGEGQKMVVIDPGHGGVELGAVYGGVYEKNINLDIAKRLNELLKKNNINTYMMRQDDIFVGLYERAYIANDLNASLFLSIHNNAADSKSAEGTMTLYSPDRVNGSQSKEFAGIIQRNLISALGTGDREIIERPNLVVLKATTMPASLAEVAFMSNKKDFNSLLSEAFRQKAAEALCKSVMEALEKIKY